MKAIILAAGEGRRLRPLTIDRPKCMIEYQGKTIIDHQLEAMRACGIQSIILIKGYCADALKREGTLEVINSKYAETNMVWTLFCAESHFDDDIIVSYGDILYEKPILEALLTSQELFSVTVSMNWRELWQKRMENPLADAETMKLDASGYIRELGKKPRSYADIEGQYMGLFKIKKELWPRLQKLYHEADRKQIYDGKDYANMYMTSFIQLAIDSGIPVKAVPVNGEWLEIDRIEDLNVAIFF